MKFQLGRKARLAKPILQLRKTKKGICKFSVRFLAFSNKTLTVQKIVLSSSRGQGNFRRSKASRPRPKTSKCVLEAKDVLEDSISGNHTIKFFAHFSGIKRGKGRASLRLTIAGPVSNFTAQPCENENQCVEGLSKFLGGKRTELYLASKFSKSRHSQ